MHRFGHYRSRRIWEVPPHRLVHRITRRLCGNGGGVSRMRPTSNWFADDRSRRIWEVPPHRLVHRITRRLCGNGGGVSRMRPTSNRFADDRSRRIREVPTRGTKHSARSLLCGNGVAVGCILDRPRSFDSADQFTDCTHHGWGTFKCTVRWWSESAHLGCAPHGVGSFPRGHRLCGNGVACQNAPYVAPLPAPKAVPDTAAFELRFWQPLNTEGLNPMNSLPLQWLINHKLNDI